MPTKDSRSNQPASRADFPLALICALPLKADAIEALFDKYWDCNEYSKAPSNPNAYSTRRIGNYNVVLAYIPKAGKANGAADATNCHVSFPNVRLAIVVGICGVVPFIPGPRSEQHEVILCKTDLGTLYSSAAETTPILSVFLLFFPFPLRQFQKRADLFHSITV
jgi:hypothetical protein